MRIPRSEFTNNITTGSSTRLLYSLDETYVPSCITSGIMVGAELDIVVCVREVSKAGRTRCDANVEGSVGAASLITLYIKGPSQPTHLDSANGAPKQGC